MKHLLPAFRYSLEIVCIFCCYCLSHNFPYSLVLAHDFIRCLLNAISGEKFQHGFFSYLSYAPGEMSKRSHVYMFYLWATSSINCNAANWFLKALNLKYIQRIVGHTNVKCLMKVAGWNVENGEETRKNLACSLQRSVVRRASEFQMPFFAFPFNLFKRVIIPPKYEACFLQHLAIPSVLHSKFFLPSNDESVYFKDF